MFTVVLKEWLLVCVLCFRYLAVEHLLVQCDISELFLQVCIGDAISLFVCHTIANFSICHYYFW